MKTMCSASVTLSPYELWYGRNEPPPESSVLRAGPLTALWEGGDLRSVRAGKVELLRRVYISVRDENWDTIPAQIRNVSTDIGEDGFTISYNAESRSRSLAFQWRSTIIGDQSGTITFKLHGQALRNFSYSHIGFCILHPLSEYCGQPFSGLGPDGPISGSLPTLIAPQRYEGGFYLPLFPPISSLSVSLKSGVKVSFAFEGDLFEMEDQRNWTDGSFKTYCTPLSLGYPHQAHAGRIFRQQITFATEGCTAPSVTGDSNVQLNLGASFQRSLPSIGLSVASHDVGLSPGDVDLLGELYLDHLRVDLHLGQPDVLDRLDRAERECSLLHCAVELAIFVTDNAVLELTSLASHLPLSVPVARILIFCEKEMTTPAKCVETVRRILSARVPNAPICGGTNTYFAEINRSRPDVRNLDGICYSVNPQVHAFDERSLAENLEGQGDTVLTACSFCGNLPIVISPITLKPRFNPDAIEPEPVVPPGELPHAVDPRQMSLFAAVWTLCSIKQFAEAGAASLTFHETTGWRGVMETGRGSPVPQIFRSVPGMIFPIYHVIADLADLKDAELLNCDSSDSLRVQGFALKKDGCVRVLIANLTSRSQECSAVSLTGNQMEVHLLDANNALLAMTRPKEFRTKVNNSEYHVSDGALALTLSPYSITRIDYVSKAQ